MATKKTTTIPEEKTAGTDDQLQAEILSGIIDPDTRTYTMQKDISIAGAKRTGTFRFRYPTIADRIRQGVLQSRFLGGVSVDSLDVVTYNIAYAMAFLASVSVQLPKWFKFEDMESVDELQEMFVEVNNFVDSFRRANESAAHAENSEISAGTETVAAC